MITENEVEVALQNSFSQQGSNDFWSYLRWNGNLPLQVGDLTIEFVDDFGGEGRGDTAWVIVKASKGSDSALFRKDGYYASYYGFEWDGSFYRVEAKEKTITVYSELVGDTYDSFDSFDEEDSFQ